MGQLQLETEPDEVGFDPRRLQRIDDHFARYVDDGRLPGWLMLVSRRGKIAHLTTHGMRDTEAALPVETDTLFRIYSMTKPITSVAAMMLYERGAFELNDPVSRFLPAFAEPRVYVDGPPEDPVTRPAAEPIRLWHLLTHTSGLTYGFQRAHPVDQLYREQGFDASFPRGVDIAGVCDLWAQLPLLFEPGQAWSYSVATDVLGRVVELVSGQSLDEFFQQHIFDPLDMRDTGYSVAETELGRLFAMYLPDKQGKAAHNDKVGKVRTTRPRITAGGAGLVTSARDYHRFAQMLLGRGQLEGTRLLGSRTVDYMARNHLPGAQDLATLAQGRFGDITGTGHGFGFGFAVNDSPVAAKVLSSPGTFGWSGMASTWFWVDPAEEITALFMSQLLPSETHPIQSQLLPLVYQALVD